MPKRRRKSEPTDREKQAMATKIVNQLVEADKAGMTYIADLLNGDTNLVELFERTFPAGVKRRVYDDLRLYEQTKMFTH